MDKSVVGHLLQPKFKGSFVGEGRRDGGEKHRSGMAGSWRALVDKTKQGARDEAFVRLLLGSSLLHLHSTSVPLLSLSISTNFKRLHFLKTFVLS